jgi:hypothetical protein
MKMRKKIHGNEKSSPLPICVQINPCLRLFSSSSSSPSLLQAREQRINITWEHKPFLTLAKRL